LISLKHAGRLAVQDIDRKSSVQRLGKGTKSNEGTPEQELRRQVMRKEMTTRDDGRILIYYTFVAVDDSQGEQGTVHV
jgi:hypothetical protein